MVAYGRFDCICLALALGTFSVLSNLRTNLSKHNPRSFFRRLLAFLCPLLFSKSTTSRCVKYKTLSCFDALYIAQLLESDHVSNAAGSRIITSSSQRLEMRCTASSILKSTLCLKRTKTTPTTAQATRKSLKKISRKKKKNNVLKVTLFLQDSLKGL